MITPTNNVAKLAEKHTPGMLPSGQSKLLVARRAGGLTVINSDNNSTRQRMILTNNKKLAALRMPLFVRAQWRGNSYLSTIYHRVRPHMLITEQGDLRGKNDNRTVAKMFAMECQSLHSVVHRWRVRNDTTNRRHRLSGCITSSSMNDQVNYGTNPVAWSPDCF